MKDQQLIHVAYADDHTAVRKGLISLLHLMGGIQVDIEAADGAELLQKIEHAAVLPDVCILDINMHGMNGFDTLAALKKRWPGIRVLILTTFDIEMYIVRMIVGGANGYLLKTYDPEQIKNAIISIHTDGEYYADATMRHYFQGVHDKTIKLPNLTPKEIKVLERSASDLSYAEIAAEMGTTTRSVEGYRDSLFKKLKINSRVSLALFAVRTGIVPMEVDSSGKK